MNEPHCRCPEKCAACDAAERTEVDEALLQRAGALLKRLYYSAQLQPTPSWRDDIAKVLDAIRDRIGDTE